jgi:hypothetical protein
MAAILTSVYLDHIGMSHLKMFFRCFVHANTGHRQFVHIFSSSLFTTIWATDSVVK